MAAALLLAGDAGAFWRVCPGSTTDVRRHRVCTVAAQTSSSVQPADPKTRFVDALRQLLEAIAGQYGDEGTKARSALNSMQLALSDWDKTIKDDELAAASQAQTAELHKTLGLIYLDRRRLDDAVRELSAAARLDPKRADIRTFQGFAYGLIDRPASAEQAFAQAAALDPADPTTSYRLAQFLARSGQLKQAAKAQLAFRDSQEQRLALSRSDRPAPSPFIRIDLLRQVAGVAPIFPPALYFDGFAALKRGSYRNAIALLRKAAEIDPLTAGAPAEGTIESAAMLRDGRLTAAIARLRQAVDLGPDASEVHRVLGMAYWADEQYSGAIEQLEAAVRLRPDDERSRVALADVLIAGGNLAGAEQTLKEAIRLVPRSGQAHHNLGRLYDFQQRWSDAAREFRTAGDLNPVVGSDYLYATMAHACLAQPDHACAVDAAAKRVDINPNNGDAHRALGEIHLQLGEHEQALTEFLAALLVNPQDAESFAAIAQIHLRTGRYPAAIEAAQRALDINPTHKTAPYALGSALTRAGRIDEGAAALQRFEQIRTRSLEQEQRDWDLKMLNQEANVRLANGDDEAAIAALEKVVSNDPAAISLVTLGRVLKKVGRYREAIQRFRQASDLQASPEVYRLLAETYEAQGEPDEGQKYRAAYQRAKEDRLRKSGWTR